MIDRQMEHLVHLVDDLMEVTRKTREILFNLLDNARKYSSDDARIWVDVRTEPDRVEVAVPDEGIGMDPDEIDELFELFHQAERGAGGLGVGPTLARSLGAGRG